MKKKQTKVKKLDKVAQISAIKMKCLWFVARNMISINANSCGSPITR